MKSTFFVVFFTISLVSLCARAVDPVSINIKGNIVASPCEIDQDNSNINIELGESLKASDGVTEGAKVSPMIPSQIKLINCPAGTYNVTATFHGTSSTTLPDFLYANDGTAKNVAVVLERSSTSGLGNGKTYTVPVDENKQAVFPMQSYAYSLGNTTAGTISSVVSVSFTYN